MSNAYTRFHNNQVLEFADGPLPGDTYTYLSATRKWLHYAEHSEGGGMTTELIAETDVPKELRALALILNI